VIRDTLSRPVGRSAARAALLLAAGGMAVPLLPAAPAEAATRSIAITAVALAPSSAAATAGDTVTFHNADVVAHTISKMSGSWSFTAHSLSPGGSFSVRLPASSTAQKDVYRDSYSLPVVGARSRTGTVQAAKTAKPASGPAPVAVPTAPTAPTAPKPPTAAPAPAKDPKQAAKPRGKTNKAGGSAPASSSSKATAPSSAAGSSSSAGTPPAGGGTGSAALQPLTGGFLQQQQQGGTALAQAPQIAGLLPGLIPSGPVVDPLAPQVAGAPGDGRPTATTLAASRGVLPSIDSARRYGLPAVLALVLAAGVASLLVRLLLHEQPAGRRAGGLA